MAGYSKWKQNSFDPPRLLKLKLGFMIQTVEDLLFLSPQQSEYFGDHMVFIGKGGGGGESVVAYKIKEGDYRKLTTNERNH